MVDCIMGIMYIVALGCVLYDINKLQIDKLKRNSKPTNKVHFYVARDKDGDLWLYIGKPFRNNIEFHSDPKRGVFCLTYNIEYYGLKYEDYDYLKWEDEPVEVFLNLEQLRREYSMMRKDS